MKTHAATILTLTALYHGRCKPGPRVEPSVQRRVAITCSRRRRRIRDCTCRSRRRSTCRRLCSRCCRSSSRNTRPWRSADIRDCKAPRRHRSQRPSDPGQACGPGSHSPPHFAQHDAQLASSVAPVFSAEAEVFEAPGFAAPIMRVAVPRIDTIANILCIVFFIGTPVEACALYAREGKKSTFKT